VRTSYIGREKDTESELAMHGVRQYSQEYGRFVSVDALWQKYLPLTPYQYAANNPISFLDYAGTHIVGTQPAAQAALVNTMQTHFNVTPTFQSDGRMQLDAGQVAGVRQTLVSSSLSQLDGIMSIVNSETTIELNTVPGRNSVDVTVTLGGPDPTGALLPPLSGPVTSSQEEIFVTDPDRPKAGMIVFRNEWADGATFNTASGGQTNPCATCLLIHALLDHAKPFVDGGSSAARLEGVGEQNKALESQGSPPRDGSDHSGSGTPARRGP